VSEKTAASATSERSSRDTLQSVDQIFLHDQLEALLASPTLARVAARSEPSTEAPIEDEPSPYERDTEPGADARLLRDALRAGLR